MSKPTSTRVYIIAVILLIGLSLSAQLNIKVGYEYNRSNDVVLANLVSQYNAERPFLEAPLDQSKNKSGVALGLRYRYYTAAVELFAHRSTGDSEAIGNDNGSSFREKISTTNLYYGIALENQFGTIGFGASLGYETLKFKTKISGSNRNREFLNQRELASRLYLNFEFASDKIALSIKPYYHFSLGEYDLVPFKNEILPDVDINAADLVLKPSSWGITLILYNGGQ